MCARIAAKERSYDRSNNSDADARRDDRRHARTYVRSRVSIGFRPRLYDHQRVLEEQAEEFSKAYRVIRINLPGHDGSPAPTSRSYCLDDFVEDVSRVFRELNIEKAVLISLSMGGVVVQKFALKYGHLLKALVLVDTTSHGIGPDATADAFFCQRR